MEAQFILKCKTIDYNDGYASPAESCQELVIFKDGKEISLDGKELARLYNFIRPVGTAPKMSIPS